MILLDHTTAPGSTHWFVGYRPASTGNFLDSFVCFQDTVTTVRHDFADYYVMHFEKGRTVNFRSPSDAYQIEAYETEEEAEAFLAIVKAKYAQ